MDLDAFRKAASGKKSMYKKLLDKLKKNPPRDLDQQFQRLHEETFEEIDCLHCANCCKTTGPLFTPRDIERLGKHLGLKPQAFIQTYLRIDEDQDYVLQAVPCPFLGSDNYCSVYEFRPQACREYPHTDQRKMHTIFKETLLNSQICPGVSRILDRMEAAVNKQ